MGIIFPQQDFASISLSVLQFEHLLSIGAETESISAGWAFGSFEIIGISILGNSFFSIKSSIWNLASGLPHTIIC